MEMDIEPTRFGEELRRARPIGGDIDLAHVQFVFVRSRSLDSGQGLHVLGPSCRGESRATRSPSVWTASVRRPLRNGGSGHHSGLLPKVARCPVGSIASSRGRGEMRAMRLALVVDGGGPSLQQPVALPGGAAGGRRRRAKTSLARVDDAITPEQAFARMRIVELSERAIAELAPSWRAKGPAVGRTFRVILELICEKEADSEAEPGSGSASPTGHVRQLKFHLSRGIRREWRKQVLEELVLEPRLAPEAVERMIDEKSRLCFSRHTRKGHL